MVDKEKAIPLPEPEEEKLKRQRATEAQLEERREKIVELVNDFTNITNKQLADTLGVSEPTVERDIRAIKEQSWDWVHRLAKEGYVYECRMAFAKLTALSRRLNRKVVNQGDNIDPDELIKISNAIARLEALKIQIIQQPTLYALKLAVKKADNFEELLVGEQTKGWSR